MSPSSHSSPEEAELLALLRGILDSEPPAELHESASTLTERLGSQTPPPGATLPEGYRLISDLGRGGMGELYLVQNLQLDRVEVVKCIRSELVAANPSATARFEREAQALAKLSHVNIAKAYQAFQTRDGIVLAMEYVPGSDLSRIAAGSDLLPVSTVCDYIRQAALGLQYAHDRGLYHRDVKPSNIMLTPTGQVKLLDFGLVGSAEHPLGRPRLTRGRIMLGTPKYIAPEQAVNAATADARSDIYSLGCTLYELLAGRPPFEATSPGQLILAHIRDEPPKICRPGDQLPKELESLVMRMLQKLPRERPQSAREVAELLEPFCLPHPGQTATQAPAEIGRPWRSRFLKLGVAFVVLTCLVLAVAIETWPSPTAPDPPPALEESAKEVEPLELRWPADQLRAGQITAPELNGPPTSTFEFETPRLIFEKNGALRELADGVYRMRSPRNGTSGYNLCNVPKSFCCEIRGRVVGEPRNSWGINLTHLDWMKKQPSHGMRIRIDGKGIIVVDPGSFGRKDRDTAPHIGPIQHPAIKTGEEWNDLLIVWHDRTLELYVNGVAVVQPILLDRDITPATLAPSIIIPKGPAQIEFDWFRIYPGEVVAPLAQRLREAQRS